MGVLIKHLFLITMLLILISFSIFLGIGYFRYGGGGVEFFGITLSTLSYIAMNFSELKQESKSKEDE